MASSKVSNYEGQCTNCKTVVFNGKINRDKLKEWRQNKDKVPMKFCSHANCRTRVTMTVKEIKKAGTAARGK